MNFIGALGRVTETEITLAAAERHLDQLYQKEADLENWDMAVGWEAPEIERQLKVVRQSVEVTKKYIEKLREGYEKKSASAR